MHLKSQELREPVLAAYYQRMFRPAEKFECVCRGLDFVNMGSGMGVAYTAQDTLLDTYQVGMRVSTGT